MKLNGVSVTISGAILSLLLLIIEWGYPVQLGIGVLLIGWWPGYSLLLALRPVSLTRWEQWFLSLAAGYGLTIFLLLGLTFAQIPLNLWTVAGTLTSISILLSLIAWRQGAEKEHLLNSSSPHLPLLTWLIILILMIAAFFRLTNIHYSDLQGDEADILLRAVAVVYGETDALLTHSKGPGEILLLNAIGAITGRFDEQTARIPFALAGTISIGLIALLGERLFSRPVGVIAGFLAAVDGVFVSYARTAQYQSVVLMLTLSAILCYYRFSQTRERTLHILGTFFLATAFLFHFETILLIPVAFYLSIAPIMSSESNLKTSIKQLWPSAAIFSGMTATFYLPFLLHPHLERTGSYLENRIGGGDWPPFNNLGHFFYLEALKYNSLYYMLLFNGLLLGLMVFILFKHISRPWSMIVAGLIGLGAGLIWLNQPKLSALLLAGGMAIFLIHLILSSPMPYRTLWLWGGVPAWVYLFLVNRPGKHHYLFLAALAILVSVMIIQSWHIVRFRLQLRPGLGIGIGIAFLLIFAAHTYMLLVRSDLEYILTYPKHKTAWYPTEAAYPYGTRIGFGYPFRLGWQTVGMLKRTDQLAGSWAINDAGNTPDWYMLKTPQTLCYPEYVLHGEITFKDDDDFDLPFIPADFGYVPMYRIWNNDQKRMTVFKFNPLVRGKTQVTDLHESDRVSHPVTAADFGASLAPQPSPTPERTLDPVLVLGEGSELKQNAPPEYLERAKQLQGRVALIGYDLDTRYAYPEGIVPITLYWSVQNHLSLRYKVFVHLISEAGQMWTQADDFPVCGTKHANTWPLESSVLDRHLLKLPSDIPAGEYTIRVGMYEPDLNLRLNYFDIANNEQGNSLIIGRVTIKDDQKE